MSKRCQKPLNNFVTKTHFKDFTMITDIRIHSTRNGVTLTVDTPSDAYEYVYKDIPTALRKTKHVIAEVEKLEEDIRNEQE